MVDEVAGFLLPGGSLLCVIAAVESVWGCMATGGWADWSAQPPSVSKRTQPQSVRTKRKPQHTYCIYNTFITRSLPHSVCTSAPWGVVNNKRPGETLKCKYSLSRPHSLAHQSRRLHSKIAYTTHLMRKKNICINTLIQIRTALLCEVATQSPPCIVNRQRGRNTITKAQLISAFHKALIFIIHVLRAAWLLRGTESTSPPLYRLYILNSGCRVARFI